MKSQGKKRLLCCFLAVIVLLTGMCVAVKPADSYFVCDSEEFVESCTFAKPQIFSCAEELCQPTLIQRTQTFEITNSQRKIASRRLSNVFVTSIVAAILPHQIHLLTDTEDDYCSVAVSHAVLVRYIQQQDGKK